MSTIAAYVKTDSGGKYVRQLCKHWSHKLETSVDGDVGTVTFPNAVARMAADEGGIDVTITGEDRENLQRMTGEDRENLQRMTGVVSSHLDRFAFREAPLTYAWDWRD